MTAWSRWEFDHRNLVNEAPIITPLLVHYYNTTLRIIAYNFNSLFNPFLWVPIKIKLLQNIVTMQGGRRVTLYLSILLNIKQKCFAPLLHQDVQLHLL
jgi:hypothetical protein